MTRLTRFAGTFFSRAGRPEPSVFEPVQILRYLVPTALIGLALASCSARTEPIRAADPAQSQDAASPDAAPFEDAAAEPDAGFAPDAEVLPDATTSLDAAALDATALEVCNGVTCATGERCNAWTRQCQSNNIPYPPPGEDNGGLCTTEADCRSNGAGAAGGSMCITENGADYCTSPCTLPVDFGVPNAFERSDCPQGSVCFRQDQFFAGDPGRCVKACTQDSDCRTADGYTCRRTFEGRTYENGYCGPAHCASRGCFGYACSC